MKKIIEVMVIILNYNSTLVSINAAESVIDNTSGDYMICIADNHSKTAELELLKKYRNSKVITLFFEDNLGYANGNNKAIAQMSECFDFKYVVIMNPDITIFKKNTINEMVNYIEQEKDKRIIGVSPLVWNYRYADDPRMQTSAMRRFSFRNVIISSFLLHRYIFRDEYKRMIYFNDRPYLSPMEIDIPSGAFFLIKTDFFKKIGMFDERTFLYFEEIIIGQRIKENNGKLILLPDCVVKHFHGMATLKDRYTISKEMHKYRVDSIMVYLQYYLNIHRLGRFYIRCLLTFDFALRWLLMILYRGLKLND